MRRWLRIAAMAAGGILLVALILAWVLLGTSGGARFVLRKVVPRAEVGTVDGRLWGPLVLGDVRYETPGLDLRVARVRVEWRPLRLIQKRLDITTLEVDTVEARLRDTGAGGTGGGWSAASVPLEIRVAELATREVRVVTAGADTVSLGLLAAAGLARVDTFAMDSLHLRRLRVRGHEFQLSAGGRLVTGASGARDSADVEVEWSGELAGGRRVAGQGTITGGAGSLRVDQRLAAPFQATLGATIRSPWEPESLEWDLALEVPRVALSELRTGLAGQVELSVQSTGDLHSASGQASVAGTFPGVGPVNAGVRGAYGAQVLTLDTLTVDGVGRSLEVRGGGRVDLAGTPAGEVRLAWSDLAWPLDTARVVSPRGTLRVAGRVDSFRVDGDIRLRQPERSLGDWVLEGSGRLADGRLVLPALNARSATGARLSVSTDLALRDGPRGRAELQWRDLTWPPASDSATLASAQGRLQVDGSLEDFTLATSASLAGRSVPSTRLELDVRGGVGPDTIRARVQGTATTEGAGPARIEGRAAYVRTRGILAVDTLDVRSAEGGRLAVRGQVDPSDPLAVAGRARWADLGWPLGSPRYESASGQITAEPRDGQVAITADARVGGATLPAGEWRLTGRGGPSRFVVDTLEGRLLGGRVVGAGVIQRDSSTWRFQLAGDSLDPGGWRSGWDGRVGFHLDSDGELGGGGSYHVRVDSLGGTLRNRDLAGGADVRGGGGQVSLDTAWVRAGESEVGATGTVGDTLGIRWAADVASLFDLVPFASGSVTGRGTVTGPRDAPSIALDAEGQGLSWGSWASAALTARAEVVAGGRDSSSVVVALAGFEGPSLGLDSVLLGLDGTRAEHTVGLTALSPGDTVSAHAAGGVRDGVWRGRLDRLALRARSTGTWRLRSAVELTIARDSGAVEQACWEGSGELCGSASWGAAGLQWQATGQRLPMAFLDPALPQGVVTRGEFELETRGRAGAGRTPSGMFRLRSQGGDVEYARGVARTVTQRYDTLAVEATADSAGIRGSGTLRLEDLGRVEASGALSGSGPIRDRALDGRIRASVEDSGTVGRYFPGITETRGTADVELSLSGTVAAPRPEGRITLSDVGASVETAGIQLEDGRLEARSTAAGDWQLDGGIRSDTSRLTVTGTVRPPGDTTWGAQLRLEADGFKAVDTKELLVVASPRLDVRTTSDSVIVTGQIRVPRARIAVENVQGTVERSPDVVIVGPDAEAPDSAVTPAALRANVRLVLGDSVTVDARGLTGRLDGQLTFLTQPGRPPLGNGELRILNGQYRIYRQTFAIDQGQVLYANTPLSDPAVDLRITRETPQVTVGMNITGQASDPRVELFSTPSLGDDEILSYLIMGRPLTDLSQSEGDRVQRVARSVGLAGGNLLLARLGSMFGLEQARIEQTTVTPDSTGTEPTQPTTQTNLVLGSEILPRVHLDYAIGFGTANVIRLRYMISDHWILRTESGQETGADLLYVIGQ